MATGVKKGENQSAKPAMTWRKQAKINISGDIISGGGIKAAAAVSVWRKHGGNQASA